MLSFDLKGHGHRNVITERSKAGYELVLCDVLQNNKTKYIHPVFQNPSTLS
jgi:hypothetical protein